MKDKKYMKKEYVKIEKWDDDDKFNIQASFGCFTIIGLLIALSNVVESIFINPDNMLPMVLMISFAIVNGVIAFLISGKVFDLLNYLFGKKYVNIKK